jgi:tetratricopeptide (TPR) repeat protein
MKNKKTTNTLALLTMLLLMAPSPAQAAVQDIELAQQYLIHGNAARSIEYADLAIKAHPGDALPYITKAAALARYDRNAEALALLNHALTLRPNINNANTFELRARLLVEKGAFRSAIEDLKTAVLLQPTANRYHLLSELYFEMKQPDYAILSLNKALILAPQSPVFYRARGDIYLHQKNFEKALADYNTTIALAPGEPVGYGCRARLYEAMGKSDLAKVDQIESNKRSRLAAL